MIGNNHIWRVVEIIRVLDGDTIDCRIDRCFGQSQAFRFRVVDVDCPELSTPQGQAARSFTETWLADRAGTIYVQSAKGSTVTVGIGDGAFGRWLGDFMAFDGESTWESLTDALIDAGHVK